MGSYWSRTKNSADELQTIVAKIEELNASCTQVQKNKYNFLWWLTVLAFFTSSIYSAMIYAVNEYQEPRIFYVALTWIFCALLIWTTRFLTLQLTSIITRRYERSIRDLKNRRSKIIEQVMENEKFKVAKEILEKYGSPEDLAEITFKRVDAADQTKG